MKQKPPPENTDRPEETPDKDGSHYFNWNVKLKFLLTEFVGAGDTERDIPHPLRSDNTLCIFSTAER